MRPKILKASIIFLICSLVVSSCRKNDSSKFTATPDFNPEVAAFTSGLISSKSTIKVKLTSDFKAEISPDVPLDKEIFKIEPKVPGNAFIADARTLEFRPESGLPSGQTFMARVNLSKLIGKKGAGEFAFSFSTIPLNLKIDFKGLRSYSTSSLQWNRIEGSVMVSDAVNPSDLETILVASQDERILPVSWDHGEKNIHEFVVDSVERKETSGKVDITWDGKQSGINIKGSRQFDIPALGDFTFMDFHIVQHPDQHVSLLFSDPILSGQDLEGIISLENNTSLRFSIQDNEVRVYPSVRQQGKLNLNISPGIINILGYRYQQAQTLTLNFEELKPAVRLIGQGVILPGTEGLIFPFEAVNLKAVDVKVIRIYEDNIAQFLQVNELDGNNELKRAGRLILKKTVDLIPERPINFNEWNAFSLDLSQLAKPDPGAMYRVEISFRKKHSLYSCGGEDIESNLNKKNDEFEVITENDLAYWDAGYGYYDYDYDYDYFNWYEKDDPCSDSYYSYYDRKVARNVLSSNIGIIAKAGQDNSYLFAVTELSSTKPLGGVKLDVFNFQQQLIASLMTNQDGIAKSTFDQHPFLVIASSDDEKAYLRVDNGSALSISQFDISGNQTTKGLKAFIYGERGVWRPGDSIFITCILEDREKTLPVDHPVTFELSDPLGKIRDSQTFTRSLNGFYAFHSVTSPDDPTGMWNLKMQVGGADFYKYLRIETVKPNRLKIDLDFGRDMILSGAERLKGILRVSWLHGAVAKGLRVNISVEFRNRPTNFNAYPDYKFDDPGRSLISVEQMIFDGQLNNQGMAEIQPTFNLRNQAPGMVNAIFTTRAFEKGGDVSINRISIPYSPYTAYCGLKAPEANRYGMLLTDSSYRFQVASVSEMGKPAPHQKLEVTIYKLNWQWWWHSADENLASYTGNPAHQPVFRTTLNTGETGKGFFDFKVEYPQWGRFLIQVNNPSSGHSCSQTLYFDWPGWSGRASRQDPGAASILPFSSDKTKYQVGETARITIPSPGEGRIFLSIENGTKVLDYYWLEANGEETSFSLTVKPEMAPNVYAYVTLIQPHAQTKNDLPIRMYGVIPILVEDPTTHLQPVITMPDLLTPESEIVISVKEENGRPMNYTLALVDDGLLDLTNFKTPDPWNAFYAREALGVSSFDLYNFVLGAYGGRIDGVYSIGGDLDAEQLTGPQKRANRFPPVVRFEGPFYLEKGKTGKHRISLPNYVGSVRTMVIAGHEGAYGNSEKTTPVRKPLMVLSTLPRVLGPGEEVQLPVTVFAMEDNIRKVSVTVEANNMLEISENSKSIDFEQAGDKNLYFTVRVKERIGIANLKVTATSGNEAAYHETQLMVRSPNPEVTRFSYAELEPGESREIITELPGMSGTNSLILEAFSMVPFDFGRRLKELLRYPHGCLEQVTSAGFPQLYLSDVMEADKAMLKMTEENVRATVREIGKFLLPGGDFSYWPGATAGNDWATSYAGHFLLEAKEKGYDISQTWIDSWLRHQRQTSRAWTGKIYDSPWHQRALYMYQSYRLYTLALAGKPEMGAMNRLREDEKLSPIAAWQLAAAYALSGHIETAKHMVEGLTTGTDTYETPQLYTYGSELRDKAIILETLTLIGDKNRAIPLLQHISENLSRDVWYSTQSTAWALKAVTKYAGKYAGEGEIRFDYGWDGESMQSAVTTYPLASISRETGEKRSTRLNIKNNGDKTLFLRIAASGIPLAGEEQFAGNNLVMKTEYRLLDGNPVDVTNLEQGTDVLAIVTLRNPGTLGNYKDMALTRIFPSGWEIQNMRIFESQPVMQNLLFKDPSERFDHPDYQDIRDDRVLSYFDLPAYKSLRFAVKLTASYVGKYYMPAVGCEAMYRKDINAVIPGHWVEVKEAGR